MTEPPIGKQLTRAKLVRGAAWALAFAYAVLPFEAVYHAIATWGIQSRASGEGDIIATSFFMLSALSSIGLLRMTNWGRILASFLLWTLALVWLALITPVPADRSHSILEPLLGEPLPTLEYLACVTLGVFVLLSPIVFFSANRHLFRHKWW